MATPRRTLRSSTSSAQPSAPSNNALTSTTTPTAVPAPSSTATGANFKVKTLAEIKAEKQKRKQNNGAAKPEVLTLDTTTPAPPVPDVVVTAKPASQALQPLSTGAASLASKKQMLMEARARKEAEKLKSEPPTDAAANDNTNASRLSADAKPFMPQTDTANTDTAMDESVSDDVISVVPMSDHQLSPLPPSTKSATTNDVETRNAQKPLAPLRKRKAVELSNSAASSSASSNSSTLTTSVVSPLQSTMPIALPSSQNTNGDHNTSATSLPAVLSSSLSLPPTSVPVVIRPKKKLRRDFSATNVLEMKIPTKNESEDEVVKSEPPLQLPTANELEVAPSDADLSSSQEKYAVDVEMMHDDIASTDADYGVAAPAPIDFSALDAEIEKFEAEFGVTHSDMINVNDTSDIDWNEIDREIDEIQSKINKQQ